MSISSISVTDAPQAVAFGNHGASTSQTELVRGVLLVEPSVFLLSAEALLLSESNYCVTTAFSLGEIVILRDTKAIALAIVSDALGSRLLGIVAATIRKQWPLARILIIGQAATMLEDQLYDEQVERSTEPKQLLDDLERLYKNSWDQRSHTIFWNGGRSCTFPARLPLLESDPTKVATATIDEDYVSGTPSGILYRPR